MGTLVFVAGCILMGGFFAISGFQKIVIRARREGMVETMRHLNIPLPHIAAPFTAWSELVFGATLMLNIEPMLSAFPLLVICFVVCVTEVPKQVQAFNPLNIADRCITWLWLPQPVYALILLAIMLTAPAPFFWGWPWTI